MRQLISKILCAELFTPHKQSPVMLICNNISNYSKELSAKLIYHLVKMIANCLCLLVTELNPGWDPNVASTNQWCYLPGLRCNLYISKQNHKRSVISKVVESVDIQLPDIQCSVWTYLLCVLKTTIFVAKSSAETLWVRHLPPKQEAVQRHCGCDVPWSPLIKV